jgi:hypothetical protein
MSIDGNATKHDTEILRELGLKLREHAESDVNRERRRLWYDLDGGGAARPLILSETDGGFQMIRPDLRLRCREPWAQSQEWVLRSAIVHFENIQDDSPIEPFVNCPWQIEVSGYGVEMKTTNPEAQEMRGAYHIDPALTDLEKDIHRLRKRTFTVKREETLAEKTCLEEVFDGILPVRMRGNPWWTLGLTSTAIRLVGLEQLMLYMYDQPAALHQLMAFLRDDHLALVQWMEDEGLLTLNNENDYMGSGSRGYTRRLPADGEGGKRPVTARDLWVLLESQETVGVGPDLYAEFVFPYENAIAERFGSVYYGCCEPVHTRWHVLKKMANLERVSVSPWCNEEFMAPQLADRFVYSRKPNPAMISTAHFDEELIRRDLRHTLELTREHGCRLEIVMKDVHTLHGEPDRLARWVRLAREESENVW